MSCYHPLIAYARPSPKENGKKELYFIKQGSVDFNAPFVEKDGHLYTERLELPCGQCIGCRMAYAREWAIRCVLEAKQWKHNYFLTITYDDQHLKYNDIPIPDPETGEVIDYVSGLNPTLRKKDLQDFFKLLRRESEYHFDHVGIRFFCCGEYGGQTQRPHYHVILFNAPPLDDLVLYKRSSIGHNLYNSAFLDKIWKKGYIVVGAVTYEACCYTARYMLKKHKGVDRDWYDRQQIDSEFTNCSRRPGIGFSFYEAEKSNIYEFDKIVITDSTGKAKVVRPPKYYDRLYDIDCPDELSRIKSDRIEAALTSKAQALSKTDLSPVDYLALQEKNSLERIKFLPRSLC